MALPHNHITLPKNAQSHQEIFQQLRAFKAQDIPWQHGRTFAYVYEPPAETKAVIAEAMQLYISENALDPTAFPSLLKLETDVVSMVANLLGGNADTVGNFTSGGTESIILALKTARDYFREHRPNVQQPEVIVCETAHAAFHKAAHYLGLSIRLVPMDKNYQIDLNAVRQAINPNTILLVGSAPNYSHGVIDPIQELAQLALQHGILCHVDACVGGFYLPFLRLLGHQIPPFDFSVEGVTSISCDIHKYGYTAKGASVVLHKNAQLRKYQIFTCSDWTGYTIINPTVLSSKSGATLAAAWAAIHHLGQEGYMRMANTTQQATADFIKGINQIKGLHTLGQPAMNLVAVASHNPQINVFSIADQLKKRGWHIQVQLGCLRSPAALHLNINHANTPLIPELLADIAEVAAHIAAQEEQLPTFSPDMLAALFGPSTSFDELAQSLGLDDPNGLPDDFAPINNMLEQLPNALRSHLLTEFANRLYTTK